MSTLDDLEKAGRELNAKADEAAAYVQKLEQKLATAGVGTLIVDVDYNLSVSFERYGKRAAWRILVKMRDRVMPWSEWNRTTKLQTVGYMDNLVRLSYKRLADQQKAINVTLDTIKGEL